MKVILQQDVANLGKVGEQVTVKAGYGRNFLIPHGKATPATAANIAKFEEKRAEYERIAQENLDSAQKRADQLENKTITITTTAGEGGKLFGSIGPRDIAAAITDSGIEVEKSEVSMPEGPIRQTGEYDITLRLHSSVSATVKIAITEA